MYRFWTNGRGIERWQHLFDASFWSGEGGNRFRDDYGVD